MKVKHKFYFMKLKTLLFIIPIIKLPIFRHSLTFYPHCQATVWFCLLLSREDIAVSVGFIRVCCSKDPQWEYWIDWSCCYLVVLGQHYFHSFSAKAMSSLDPRVLKSRAIGGCQTDNSSPNSRCYHLFSLLFSFKKEIMKEWWC